VSASSEPPGTRPDDAAPAGPGSGPETTRESGILPGRVGDSSSAGTGSPDSGTGAPERAKARTVLGAGSRDMVISMLILLPIVGLVALLGRSCSFSPGGPTFDSSQMPSTDPHPTLVAAAARLGFPVREPMPPAGWRATVVNLDPAPGPARAVRISWITTGGRYLRAVQTTAAEEPLVAAETGGAPTRAVPLRAAGVSWVDYTGGNGEQAWARRDGPVEWLITGDALPAEFTALAGALVHAPVLPTR
jgi:hypothetical protein